MTVAQTGRRVALLQAIASHWRLWGVGPSYRELARDLGLHSKASVDYRLERAVAAGLVHIHEGLDRSMHLSPAGCEALGEPVRCGERCQRG